MLTPCAGTQLATYQTMVNHSDDVRPPGAHRCLGLPVALLDYDRCLMTCAKTRWCWSLAVARTAPLVAKVAVSSMHAGAVAHAQLTAGTATAWSIGGPGADEARQLSV